MRNFGVALANPGAYHFGDVWIEFYAADDSDHAREQAVDANPSAEVLAIRAMYDPQTGNDL